MKIIAEPGRYYVASAYTLAVNIIAKKVVMDEQSASDGMQILSEHQFCEERLNGSEFDQSTVCLMTSWLFFSPPFSEEDDGTNDRTVMYYVNDGVYGSFNCILYDHAHVQPTLHKVSQC